MSPSYGRVGVLLAACVCACSGGTAGRGEATSDASVGSLEDERPAVETREPPDVPSVCPAAMPSEGATCPCAYSCEFGTDPDVRCNTLMTGAHGQWTVTRHPDAAGCEGVHAPACPLEFAGLAPGGECILEGLACAYPEARCDCSAACDVGGSPTSPRWCCSDAVQPGSGCPAVRPRIGTGCTVEGESCDYGGCSGNVSLTCVTAVWQDVPRACSS
jgi:hypothetical protein